MLKHPDICNSKLRSNELSIKLVIVKLVHLKPFISAHFLLRLASYSNSTKRLLCKLKGLANLADAVLTTLQQRICAQCADVNNAIVHYNKFFSVNS